MPARALKNVPTQLALSFGAPGTSVWNDDAGQRPLGRHRVGAEDVDGQLGDLLWYSLQYSLKMPDSGPGLVAVEELRERRAARGSA